MTSDNDQPLPRKGGGSDREKSVGDFLLEVDEVLRPLIDLTTLFDTAHYDEASATYRIPYREEKDAFRARLRLQLLLDDGEAINVRRAIDTSTQEFHWRLSVPYAEAETIKELLDKRTTLREEAARALQQNDRQPAVTLRNELRNTLAKDGLIVDIPDAMVERLLKAYDQFLVHQDFPHPSRSNFLPMLRVIRETDPERLYGTNEQEKEFLAAAHAIADEIFRQRKGKGKSSNPALIDHYFPDGYMALIEQAVGKRWDNITLLTPQPTLPREGTNFGLGQMSPFAYAAAVGGLALGSDKPVVGEQTGRLTRGKEHEGDPKGKTRH